MTDAPPDQVLVQSLMDSTGLPEGTIKGVCGALAASGRFRQDRAVMLDVATTWGAAYEQVELMAALRLPDLQAAIRGAASQGLMIAGLAQDLLVKKLGNPGIVDKLGPKDLSTIAKQQFDIADKATATKGPGTVNTININGDVSLIRTLKELRSTEKPARARVMARLRERAVEAVTT